MEKVYPPSTSPFGADGDWPETLTLREAVLRALSSAERVKLESLKGEAFELYGTLTPSAQGRPYWELCCKGWSKLKPHFLHRELLLTGRDKFDRFGPRRPVPVEWLPEGPIEWGPSGFVNFEKWELRLEGLTVVDVEVSWGCLEVYDSSRRARLGPLDLKLSPRSLDIFLILARAAKVGRLATLEELSKTLPKVHGEKALGQAINRLKGDLEDSGVSPSFVDRLISNVRGEGYRLNWPPSHVLCD